MIFWDKPSIGELVIKLLQGQMLLLKGDWWLSIIVLLPNDLDFFCMDAWPWLAWPWLPSPTPKPWPPPPPLTMSPWVKPRLLLWIPQSPFGHWEVTKGIVPSCIFYSVCVHLVILAVMALQIRPCVCVCAGHKTEINAWNKILRSAFRDGTLLNVVYRCVLGRPRTPYLYYRSFI